MTLESSQEIRDVLDTLNSQRNDFDIDTGQDIQDVLDVSNAERDRADENESGDTDIEVIPRQRACPSTSTSGRRLIQSTLDKSTPLDKPSTWKKRAPGRQATSKVWDYFLYDSVSDYSKCNILGCTTEKIKGKNTSNLKKHLQHAHEEEFTLVTKSDSTLKLKATPIKETSESLTTQLRLNPNATLVDLKYEKNNPKQMKWTRQITFLFGAYPVPNYLIHNADFRKSYEIADPKLVIPSRQSLEKSIDRLMVEVRLIITQRLNLARRVNISSDIWTKKGMSGSYLGVMATIYDTGEERKLNMVLSVKKFEQVRHTATNIQEEMQSVLQIYRLHESKIWKMITDSGSNMVCAFRDQLNTDLDSPEFDECEDLYNFEDIVDDQDNQQGPSSKYGRLSCFIHSLLLCLKKFEAGKIFENLVTKVKLLVSKFSSSQVLTRELIELSGLKLISFSNTRWNITFLVVQRLYLVKASVIIVLEKYGKSKYNLNESEWNLLSKTQDYLAPFNKFTDMSRTEGTRALSEVVMILKQLQTHLQKYSSVRPFITVSKEILSDLSVRFGHFLKRLSETASKPFEGVYLASTLLDPRYRIGLSATEKDLAKTYILTSDWDWESQNRIDESKNVPNTDSEVVKKKRKFDFLEEFSGECVSNNLDLVNELNMYLDNKGFDVDDDQCDPWNFWNQHKSTFAILSPIALEILSIPLSIGHVERIFSFAGFATGGRRNSLDSEHLDLEVFLNKNKHLLKFT